MEIHALLAAHALPADLRATPLVAPTVADAARLRADLDYVPAVPIERGLGAEAEWTRGLYAGSGR